MKSLGNLYLYLIIGDKLYSLYHCVTTGFTVCFFQYVLYLKAKINVILALTNSCFAAKLCSNPNDFIWNSRGDPKVSKDTFGQKDAKDIRVRASIKSRNWVILYMIR